MADSVPPVGRSPWTAGRSLPELDRRRLFLAADGAGPGVRRGRGRPPHTRSAAFSIVILLALAGCTSKPPQPLELTPEAKAYVRNLQLSDVNMKATSNYMKQTIVEIEGKITNAGDRPIDIVEIYCQFYDTNRLLVLRQRLPIVSTKMGGLKPGDTKSFRLPFDDLPESWNQQVPQLVIAAVKFT